MGKLRQVIRILKALFKYYPPQELEIFRNESGIEGVFAISPLTHLVV